MKKKYLKNLDDSHFFQLDLNQTLSFDVRQVQIECLQGIIWVTWPDGNDRVLLKGQSMVVNSRGMICVQAFSAASMIARKVHNGRPLLGTWLKKHIWAH